MITSYFLTILLFLFLQLSLQQLIPLPQSVITALSDRKFRYKHYLWHNIRDNWLFFTPATQQQLTALGWGAPRPARNRDASGNIIAMTDNNSGEDFLYMHRQMMRKVNEIIALNNETQGPVTGWKTVPGPTDLDFPVPANFIIPGNPSATASTNSIKTASHYTNTMKPYENYFKDPNQLRQMTLGQLGSRLENTMHAWMHIRWCGQSLYGYRPGSLTTIPQVDIKWDNPQYNWMLDSYGSHLDPIFWKLHGWIDDRVEDWMKAKGLTSITWTGTWEGGPIENIPAAGNQRASSASISRGSTTVVKKEYKGGRNTMDLVFEILSRERQRESSVGDIVKVDFEVPRPGVKNPRK